ncbi:MAG TPA: hypothetical protein VFZ21_30370 [Gemmatimonadaceae bacterium]|jgi:hypothetical protein|nr:hypothetical protein [Gemmatimonadaceae bacterium]
MGMTGFGFNIPLRQRIGIGVSSDRVRALALDGSEVAWACERVKANDESLEQALLDLLTSAPISRWHRQSTFVALGPATARVKRLSGLPAVADKGLAYQLVSENADRFFPRHQARASVRAVEEIGNGEVWAAAVDDATVAMVQRVCASLRLRVRSFVPAIAAALAATDDTEFEIADGSVRATVQARDGRLAAVRYRHIMGVRPTEGPTSIVAPLRAIGTDAGSYTDAYGAVVRGMAAPLSFRNNGAPIGDAHKIPRWRRAAAAAALSLGIAAPFVAMIAAPARARARDEAVLRALDERARAARATHADLVRFTAAVNAAASFTNSRRSQSVLVAELTEALPGGTAIVSFRVDSAAGSLVVLGQRATAALSSLEKVDDVVNPRLAGPVTRELVAGRELERASIQFLLFPRGGATRPEATTPAAGSRGER